MTGGDAEVALVCPDKFRGTLTAAEAAAAMRAGVTRAGFVSVIVRPMADGGEGTIDAIRASVGGSLKRQRVTGPLGSPVEAEWLVLPDGTALVEMARASGLLLARADGPNDPLRASTRGTGELIAAARRAGARRIVVAVGGSASTDGGQGALEVLGATLGGVELVVACDVTTTFLDAARIFGPQKGATEAEVALLTRRLEQLAGTYEQRHGVDVRGIEGGGAAGGLAGGLAAIGATIEAGFEVVARLVDFDEALEAADLVVTGEGRLDAASFTGKVVGSVCEWANEVATPKRAIIAGQVTDDAREEATTYPETMVFALTDRVPHAGAAFQEPARLVEDAAFDAGRWARGQDPSLAG